MISSLHGVVLHATSDQVVIDVGGVGFAVAVPADVAHTAVVGEKLLLHTSLIVREDSLSLFGFADRGELEIFGLLISVTGVGPKSALGVLSHLTADQIAEAVTAEDDAPFRRVSGIGPKTAAQLIHEYGDLDTLLARAGEIKQPKRRETLINFADQIRLSRELVTLTCDAPAPEAVDDFLIRDPDPAVLSEFLERMEFRSLLRRVGDGKAPPKEGSTFARQPLLAIPLVFGLLLAFGALVLRLTSLAFGEPRGSAAPAEASYLPMFAHFALVLTAGIYLPRPLVVWFQHVANLLG